ncbi:MAG: hypothetical protein INR69_22210, partial [Mucilaginibacter polytrichastri]|nr:hypothetical protein [Mucilaginibacter polytrichastri]
PFKIRFKSYGEKTVKQTIDKQHRDSLSIKIYQLYQKKHFETELMNLLMNDEVVFAGLVSPNLHPKLHWDNVRTHTFTIREIDRNVEPPEMTLNFSYEALSHDYICVAILNEQTYVCYRKDGKKDKELLVIKTDDRLTANYAGKAK